MGQPVFQSDTVLHRGQKDVDSPLIEDDSIRVYEPTAASDSSEYPSVTTVKDLRHDPDKKDAIDGWKSHYDGQFGKPHWRDLRNFAGWRGTLAHYTCLNPLTDRELYGDEEDEAEAAIKEFGEFKDSNMQTHCLKQVNWVKSQWDAIVPEWGLTKENTIAVEQYVYDDNTGYAGQFDWLGEVDGEIILADLKTSSLKDNSNEDEPPDYSESIGQKIDGYGMQMAAYANAIDGYEIDNAWTIWLSPKYENTTVLTEVDWPRTRESYFTEFAGLAERMNEDVLVSDVASSD